MQEKNASHGIVLYLCQPVKHKCNLDLNASKLDSSASHITYCLELDHRTSELILIGSKSWISLCQCYNATSLGNWD